LKQFHQIGAGKKVAQKAAEGSRKKPILAKTSEHLAEIIGVILSDGHFEESRKVGHYAVKICEGEDNVEYLACYGTSLFLSVFGKRLKSFKLKRPKGVMFYVYDKSVVHTLKRYGLKPGNKKDNDVRIPKWISDDSEYLRACLKGIFDTDGTVFPKSANSRRPHLELTSKIGGIQKTFRRGLQQLDFRPSRWSKTDSPNAAYMQRAKSQDS
jgi:intein/homing endonuclease